MKNSYRIACLAFVTVATTLSLGKAAIDPQGKITSVEGYYFPESIPLSNWELSFTQPVNPRLVKPPAYILGDFVAGKHYRYRQSDRYLQIEMRYLINTNGDLKGFIKNQTGDFSSSLRQDEERGFYSLYADRDKVYLNACINPRGISTVTSDEFNRNLMISDTHLAGTLSWLLGKNELRDKRCLWTNLSRPLDNKISLEENYRTLEMVWFDWYDWWRLHYPDV